MKNKIWIYYILSIFIAILLYFSILGIGAISILIAPLLAILISNFKNAKIRKNIIHLLSSIIIVYIIYSIYILKTCGELLCGVWNLFILLFIFISLPFFMFFYIKNISNKENQIINNKYIS